MLDIVTENTQVRSWRQIELVTTWNLHQLYSSKLKQSGLDAKPFVKRDAQAAAAASVAIVEKKDEKKETKETKRDGNGEEEKKDDAKDANKIRQKIMGKAKKTDDAPDTMEEIAAKQATMLAQNYDIRAELLETLEIKLR